MDIEVEVEGVPIDGIGYRWIYHTFLYLLFNWVGSLITTIMAVCERR